MKKHLLLILALLAFVLPARAGSLLINFVGNDDNRTSNTLITAGMDLNKVFTGFDGDEVTYPLVISNYVSSITAASNAYYNDINSMRLGANGSLTFKLAKKYKVTGYDIRGYKKTDVARVTINGHTVDGPTVTTNSGQQSNVPVQLSATEEIDQIAISTDKEVYIKGICIYYETDASSLTVNVAPAPGTYNVGQVVMAMSNNSSAALQFFVDKKSSDGSYSENVLDQDETGSASYNFSEPGEYRVTAQAHYGGYENWDNSSEQFIGYYTIEGDEPTPATLSVNLKTGSYKLPQTVTVTSSKTDDDIIVILTDENNQEVVNGTFTGTWSYNFTTPGTFALEARNGDGATISEIYELGYAPEAPVFSKANGAYTNGTEVTISSKYATKLAVKIIKKADYDANGFNATGTQTIYDADSHTLTLTEDVVIVAQGKNDFGTTSTDYRIYTISNPVKPNVAPVISFSPEDQKVFGSEEEIDVTLNLNHDVYPVPNVIYYTLDGFMAHNTLETGTPGATPAGHVLEAAVNPSTLSGTVRIERSHREALNHRAVTINAYTFNTAGSDVAAATYIFNNNAAPLPDPKPTTITATVTMANQGWTSGPYSASSKNATWTSDEIVALDNATLSFETSVTISVNSNYPTYYTKTPAGLRIYGTSYNKITIKAPTGYAFKSVKPTFEGKNSPKFYLGDFSDETNRVEMTSGQEYTLTNSASSIMLSANAGQIGLGSVVFVLEKTAAKAAVAPTTIKTATGDVYNLVTDASQIKTGDQLIIASHYYKTGKSADDNHYVLKSVSTKGTGVKNTSLNSDNSTLAESSDCLVFTVEVDGTKDNNPAFLLKNGNNYLSGKNDGNGLSLASKANISYCTITNGESGWGDNAMNVYFYNCGTGGNLMCYTGTTFNAYKSTSCSERSATNDQYSNVILYRKSTGGPTVDAPVISLSERANTTEPVTVTIDCATEGATVTYTVKKDGTTVADNLTYDHANKPVFSEVGSYTVNATASKEGMNPANATPANFTIEKLVEVVEELFFVMDQNLWDVDGAYPETVVPFEYKGNNTYDLEITKIPAKGWYMNKNGIWTAIEHGFRGNFYVRDGKANHKGLVFGATGTVADATFATRAAAAGNQMVEPHTKYNMYVVNEGETHKVFTTIDDNSSKAFTDGTIRVTHTPGNKDAAKTMTLEILAEDNQTTGVDSITAEDAASDADARFFNLQGVEVPADRLAPGIYIRQAGSKATKVLVK